MTPPHSFYRSSGGKAKARGQLMRLQRAQGGAVVMVGMCVLACGQGAAWFACCASAALKVAAVDSGQFLVLCDRCHIFHGVIGLPRLCDHI